MGPRLWDKLLWPIRRGDLAPLLDAYADLAGRADEAYPELLARCAGHDARLAASDGSRRSLVGVPMERFVRQEAECATRRAVTGAGASVLAFRRANGRWPSSLDAAGAAADDPRTGAPLALRAEGADVVVGPADGVGAWRVGGGR